MTLSQLYTALSNIVITGTTTLPVAYGSFRNPVNPPFCVYLMTGTNNAFADGVVYKEVDNIDIELYTETIDTALMTKVETALKNLGLAWEKTITYIDTEKLYDISYSMMMM